MWFTKMFAKSAGEEETVVQVAGPAPTTDSLPATKEPSNGHINGELHSQVNGNAPPPPLAPSSAAEELNCRGLLCPTPVLKVAKKLKKDKGVGDLIKVYCDDPAFESDIRSWAAASGNLILSLDRDSGGLMTCVIQKVA